MINDINGELINLYRCAQQHADALCAQFDATLASRAEFSRLIKVPPETLTDIQRAARFAYLQRQSYGGHPATKATAGQFAATPTSGTRYSAKVMMRALRALHTRLEGVQIECLPWSEMIARYDRKGTLFYLDPPYPGFEDNYGKGLFTPNDYVRMAAQLRRIRGRFLLSISDRREIRDLFAWAQVDEIDTRYTTVGKSQKQVTELLISSPVKTAVKLP